MKSPKSWLLVLAGLLMLSIPATASAQVVTKFLVLPAQLRLEAGATGEISVEVQDASSRRIPPDRAPISFSSSDSTIATVSPDGSVLAVRAGRAEITVRTGTRVRTVAVLVVGGGAPSAAVVPAPAPAVTPAPARPTPTPAPVAPSQAPVGAAIQPLSIPLLQGERFKPTFRLVYADGTQVETRDVVWSTFGAAIGFDANSNEVVGVGPGPGTLTGKYGTSITSAVPVTVAESVLEFDRDAVDLVVGGQDTVSLVVPAQGRRTVTQNLTWRSTAPGVMRVASPTSGVVEGVSAGTATLIVDGYGAPRVLAVRVVPRTARIETTPPSGSNVAVGTGGTFELTARPFGTDGAALPQTTLTWRIEDSTIAKVDQRGVLTGLREGATRVRLLAPGMEPLTWPVMTAPTRVAFDRRAAAVVAGTTMKLPVALRGSDQRDFGTPIAPRFTSLTPDLVTVSSDGSVRGVLPGRGMIVVSQEGAGADTATVFVTGRALIAGSIAGVRGLWQLVATSDTLPTLLARVDTGGQVSQAVWSPDRTRIALTVEPMERGGMPRVMVLDADGQNFTRLGPDTIGTSDPSWTADGSGVLMAARDAKSTSILRVALRTRDVAVLATSTTTKLRYPIAEADTASVLVRLETSGQQQDIARVKGGTITPLSEGKPSEEFIAPLRGGRLLVALDSSARGRPSALQIVSPASDRLDAMTVVRVPPGLTISDISAGDDDGSVIVVARARSWPGASRAVIVVLRVPLDGTESKTLLLLNERDLVTVRTP